MVYTPDLLNREVKIDDKEGEVTKRLGTSFLEVTFFNVNAGKTVIDMKDVEKYLV